MVKPLFLPTNFCYSFSLTVAVILLLTAVAANAKPVFLKNSRLENCAMLCYFFVTMRVVSSAIISSSSVGTTATVTLLSGVEMIAS
jgi:hypothetical protein